MSSEPSRAASLFWSCASFGSYVRVANVRFGRSVGYLGVLGLVGALAATLFFGSQIVPILRAAAKQTTGFVLSDGRLAVTPDSPTIPYDDGKHGMLLIRVAVDKEPPAPERRYDVMLTLRQRGVDCVLFGHTLQLPWPPQLSVDAQRLEMIAFMDSWWLLMCMIVYAAVFLWFFVSRFVHALIGALVLVSLTSPTREVGFVRGFNIAAHATTPGTLLALGQLWLAVYYRLDPLLINWSWLLYLLVFFVYLAGAVNALPSKAANPWATRGGRTME